ncbi:MAG: hypothetical protein ACRETQ_12935 [Gammaproteobacteria bacterium]
MPKLVLSASSAVLALAAMAPALAQTAAPVTTVQAEVPAMPACSGRLRWIVVAGSLQRSQAAFPLALQRRYFDSPCTFLVAGHRLQADYRNWVATSTQSSPSLAGVARIVENPSTAAVIYDPEAWPMTPPAEQTDPARAVCQAEAMAHAHHKLLIATPAVDLLRFVAPQSQRRLRGRGHSRRYREFEQTGLAGSIARCADVYEIQAQGSEMDTAKFRQFVLAEARQARQANPRVVILAGISTNPSGQRVTAQQLYAAVQSVRRSVSGYWLNIPAGGKYCPRCGEPQPARQLLERMDTSLHTSQATRLHQGSAIEAR